MSHLSSGSLSAATQAGKRQRQDQKHWENEMVTGKSPDKTVMTEGGRQRSQRERRCRKAKGGGGVEKTIINKPQWAWGSPRTHRLQVNVTPATMLLRPQRGWSEPAREKSASGRQEGKDARDWSPATSQRRNGCIRPHSVRSVNSGAGAVPPNHVRPVLWRPGATLEQAPQRSLWSPRPPTWAAPSPGLTSEEHRRAASVRIPRCPDVRSRQARPPALSARAPQHRAAENQPPFRQGSPGAQPRGGCLDALLPSVPVCSHQEERGSESGKAAPSGRQGAQPVPRLTPDLASSSGDMGLPQDM